MQVLEGLAASLAAVQQSHAQRAFSASPQLEQSVRDICDAVQTRGDEALLEFARQFDCPTLEVGNLRVPSSEIEDAWRDLNADAKHALERAVRNITAFHEAQKPRDFLISSPDGALLGNRFTSIERVGLYAPNGRAAYPSTVLMLAIPARVAGVRDVVLATPAARDGRAHPVILAAAHLAGISEIYLMGGAAAMAAFAYGTRTVAKVDKVVGPGSIYMTLAKKYLFGVVGIDGLYGPSEVAIVADSTLEPAQLGPQLAADLLAQAEHGGDSFVAFISPSRALCDAVLRELAAQSNASPRAKVALESLRHSLICHVENIENACELCDAIAAEHVEIWGRDALHLSTKILNAGAIFLNCPVPLGDYIIGPSHTLPTNATARFASGVGVDTFLKRTSVICASRESIASVADDLQVLAALEELPGHGEAVRRAAQG